MTSLGNKWGFHSGTLTVKTIKCLGDMYIQDDIVFSDVSAGRVAVTGGIDMQLTTSAIGIDMGGTFTTNAINIDGTLTGSTVINIAEGGQYRSLMIGAFGSETIVSGIGTDNNYQMGVFCKIDESENLTADTRCAWFRLRIDGGSALGTSANWGNGPKAIQGSVKFYGGTTTSTYCWVNAGVFGSLETDGAASVLIQDGAVAAAGFFHVGLLSTGAGNTTIEASGVACGVAINSGAASNVLATGGFYGLYIYQDDSACKDFSVGIQIDDDMTAVGMHIGDTSTAAIQFGHSDGSIVDADTSLTMYGGNTAGDNLVLRANSTDTTVLTVDGDTGLTLAGTVVTGLDISTASTSGLSINTSTPTQGILISAACGSHAINISAGQTGAGITIGSTCGTYGLDIVGACTTSGINLQGASGNGITIGGAITANGIEFVNGGSVAIGILMASDPISDTGIEISGTAANFGIDISGTQTAVGIGITGGCGTHGISITDTCLVDFYSVYNIGAQLGQYVQGIKLEHTRSADIQPSTGGWWGAQIVLNAGTGYTALDKTAYVLHCIFKGDATDPSSQTVNVIRAETQSNGKVEDLLFVSANAGSTITGDIARFVAHAAPTRSILALQNGTVGSTPVGLLIDVNETMTNGIEINAGAAVTTGFKITGASTTTIGIDLGDYCATGIDIGNCSSYGINLTGTAIPIGIHYNVDQTTASLGAWVTGMKIILERTADVVVGTSGIIGAEIIVKKGTTAYSTAYGPVIKGLRVAVGGNNAESDVDVGIFETQQDCANTRFIIQAALNSGSAMSSGGCIVQVNAYANAPRMVRCSAQAATVGTAFEIDDYSGSATITSIIETDCANTTNFLKCAADSGFLAGGHTHDTESDEIVLDVGGTPKYIKVYT